MILQRYFLNLAFLGAPFHGWQRQPGDCSVQQCVEEALSTLLRSDIQVTGAGRTDAGVNARMMPAHFDSPTEIRDTVAFLRSLNSILGKNIAAYGVIPVAPDAHARFDAVKRTYRYFATTQKTPFFNTLSWQCSPTLDFEKMNEASSLLLSASDFASFAKLHSDVKTTVCDVTAAAWHRLDEHRWYFEISADRFLRNMVRAVVGTLVEVGRGKLTIDGFREIIESRNRCNAGTSMPAHALYLWNVEYPNIKANQFYT
ncbi:MAG: tRNA pseudouridine(38-40) synthase TruA [Paramuribaculum sp.]|nr:tRNA pseudouridine(38-40) synthase TruA [Paramuribaculum sp.]